LLKFHFDLLQIGLEKHQNYHGLKKLEMEEKAVSKQILVEMVVSTDEQQQIISFEHNLEHRYRPVTIDLTIQNLFAGIQLFHLEHQLQQNQMVGMMVTCEEE